MSAHEILDRGLHHTSQIAVVACWLGLAACNIGVASSGADEGQGDAGMNRTMADSATMTGTGSTSAHGGMMGQTGQTGHGTTTPPADAGAMLPYSGSFVGALADDQNALADVVEVALEAKEANIELSSGRSVRMWTYDGVLPGPRIEAHVGDTVRVHFTNSLPEPTTIHWHGLRVPAAMDGVTVMHNPVQPGETFSYEFTVQDAGTFWYHPHVRSDEQVERGLYGAFVVRGPHEPKATTENVVVLDDVLLGADGQLAPPSEMDAMMGREGNVILANGHVLPAAEVANAGLHRFRFVNAANARYFTLALPGHELSLIGQDGSLLEQPVSVDSLLLVPGQRADVLVRTEGTVGETTMFQSLPYDRGHAMMMMGGAMSDAPIDLFSLEHAAEADDPPALPDTFAPIELLPEPTAQRELKLEESMGMMGSSGATADGGQMGHGAGHGGTGATMEMMTFSINGEVYPDVTSLQAELGDVEEWSIVNTTEMDHPFHLHGFRFQVAAVEGVAPAFPAWEDTINVKAKQTTKFRVRLDEHPGTWMFHCHILEHAERGMAGELVVSP